MFKINQYTYCFLIYFLFQIYSANTYKVAPFSKLNLRNDDITLSGISSGAFFVDQLQVIYSSLIKGIGSQAGGPFYCSQGSVSLSTAACMLNTLPIDVNTLVQKAQSYAAKGKIDPVSNIQNANVYILSGLLDTTVKQTVSYSLRDFFKAFNATIQTQFSIPCEHNWINDEYGNLCATSALPYIANCQTPVIKDMLTTIYGGSKQISDPVQQISSNLFEFDQTQFYPSDGSFSSLSDTGYAYIPTSCQQNQLCSVHFAFHGCLQNYITVGDAFVTSTHLNEYAEANNIVIIFPQVWASLDPLNYNPEGCWDWWGYTNSDFANYQGPQVQFFYNLLSKLVNLGSRKVQSK